MFIAELYWCTASSSSLRSPSSCCCTLAPILGAKATSTFGVASKNTMCSMRPSAWFISSITFSLPCIVLPSVHHFAILDNRDDVIQSTGTWQAGQQNGGEFHVSLEPFFCESLTHLRQVHLYSGTPGRTVWAQSRQTNRPSL